MTAPEWAVPSENDPSSRGDDGCCEAAAAGGWRSRSHRGSVSGGRASRALTGDGARPSREVEPGVGCRVGGAGREAADPNQGNMSAMYTQEIRKRLSQTRTQDGENGHATSHTDAGARKKESEDGINTRSQAKTE